MNDPHEYHARVAANHRQLSAQLNEDQRLYMRREYRHLRGLGMGRHTAKGTIYRTVDVAINWR